MDPTRGFCVKHHVLPEKFQESGDTSIYVFIYLHMYRRMVTRTCCPHVTVLKGGVDSGRQEGGGIFLYMDVILNALLLCCCLPPKPSSVLIMLNVDSVSSPGGHFHRLEQQAYYLTKKGDEMRTTSVVPWRRALTGSADQIVTQQIEVVDNIVARCAWPVDDCIDCCVVHLY